jgi:hypothetical protein
MFVLAQELRSDDWKVSVLIGAFFLLASIFGWLWFDKDDKKKK